ncbi:MAG: GTP cyclohydrolase I FolE [Bacillota bacterium]|jgi:GTP cyclohydrolase I
MMDKEKIETAVKMILEAIGEDPTREGLEKTPSRIADMYEQIFSGLNADPKDHLRIQFKEDKHEEMVIVKDISLYSMCEHHMLPFFGKVHIAYIPKNGIITGLSKLARVVDEYAHRLQLQERLTTQIAEAIMEVLQPQGVLVIIEAEHMCMTMRGIKKPGSLTVTSAVRGIFDYGSSTRAEALQLIKNS